MRSGWKVSGKVDEEGPGNDLPECSKDRKAVGSNGRVLSRSLMILVVFRKLTGAPVCEVDGREPGSGACVKMESSAWMGENKLRKGKREGLTNIF